jgi:ubiquinone/menaquinone biosynthesis C-methylase UbiE
MERNEVTRIRAVYAERELTHLPDRGNPGRQLMLHERNHALERILDDRLRRPLSQCRVIDIGCGYGSVLGLLHQKGAAAENLFGVDLLPNRVKRARETYPAFTFLEGNAEQLGFPDHSFDLVLLLTVVSSILDSVTARNVASSVSRVLRSTGAVAWYDIRYPNPWNPNVRAMTKSRIHSLFPDFDLELEPLSLMPPIAYQLGCLTNQVYPLLSSIRILRSHYVGLLRPRGGVPAMPSEVETQLPAKRCRHG